MPTRAKNAPKTDGGTTDPRKPGGRARWFGAFSRNTPKANRGPPNPRRPGGRARWFGALFRRVAPTQRIEPHQDPRARTSRFRAARRRLLGAALLAGASVVGSWAVVVSVRLAAARTPLPEGFFEKPSPVVYYRDGSPAHIFLSPDEKLRVPVESLDDIDPDYLADLIAFEDQRFLSHSGVDGTAIVRAVLVNILAGRVVSGASTLTMQLARMREPRPRNLRSKLIEAFRAFQLEAHLSKEQILTAYLSYAPFGGNREGVEVAARSFFGHGPRHLSAEERALLLAVPQRPTARSPASPEGRARLHRARDHILRTLAERRGFEPEPVFSAVPERIHPIPRELPHLAYALRAQYPHRQRFETSIDAQTQRSVEALVHGARRSLAARGIRHGAVVVADHESGALRAVVGNLRFWSRDHGDQISAFETPRSAGSTLKPFIYGLALEKGLILPGMLIPDVPRSFAGYIPRNYDGTFDGAVPAQEALARSLNLPFVHILRELGVETFIGELLALGATSIDPRPGRHGLSAAIGAVELTPLELAQLYTGVATDGRVRPLFVLQDSRSELAPGPGVDALYRPPGPPVRMWSAAAAHLVRDGLDDIDRPDFPRRGRWRGRASGIHWKTGTSFGHRDAWAVGARGAHTAVVWLGNMDRAPSPHLVGARAAGPLLFDVLESLPAHRGGMPPKDGLTDVEVCALTGRPASRACPHRRRVPALRHRVPVKTCDVHVFRFIDTETGLAVRPDCPGSRRVERRVFERWPLELIQHLGPRARGLPAPPSSDPRCPPQGAAATLRIVSPDAGLRLLIPGSDPRDQELPLEAEGGHGPLQWFIDGSFLGSSTPGKRLWWTPEVGRHELLVMDTAGRKRRRWLEVMGTPRP